MKPTIAAHFLKSPGWEPGGAGDAVRSHGTQPAAIKRCWGGMQLGTCAAALMDAVSPLHKKSFDEPKAL